MLMPMPMPMLMPRCRCQDFQVAVIISLYFNETKKIKLFVYIAIAKHCWVIKLGELESDQKYFAR